VRGSRLIMKKNGETVSVEGGGDRTVTQHPVIERGGSGRK
jgi:hypothetical protein